MTDFDTFERDGWASNDAGAYDRVLGPITRRAALPLLDLAGVRAGMRVLDVATGPGYVAAAAAARGANVVGVDRSAQMVELARRAHPSVTFEVADALALPDGFDVAVANFLILHVGEPERVVAEMARAGRTVALTAWGPPDRARLFGVFPEAVRAAGAPIPPLPPGPDFFRFSSDDELRRLFAGLSDVAIETLDYTTRVDDLDLLWDGMTGGTVRMRALLTRQTPDMQRAIRAELARLLAPYGGDIPVQVKIARGRS